MTDISTTRTVTIDAPPATVWKALTTPATIKEWFLGVDTESDWKVGSSIVHRGEYQGKPYEDKGEITRLEAPRVFEHTHWRPASGKPDRPEHHERVTWTLTDQGGSTRLDLLERNLPSEEAKQVSEKTWAMVLENLKKVVERRPVEV